MLHGLSVVAFGDVGAHQCPMGRLPQRLCFDREQTALHRLGVVAGRGELTAQPLEGVQAQLAEPFPIEDQPFVVPVGEQIAAEGARRGHRLVPPDVAAQHSTSQAVALADVHRHVRREAQRSADGLNDPIGGATEPPERGAQVRERVVMLDVGREDARGSRPIHRLVAHGEQRGQTLCHQRQSSGGATARKLEGSDQAQARSRCLCLFHFRLSYQHEPSPFSSGGKVPLKGRCPRAGLGSRPRGSPAPG